MLATRSTIKQVLIGNNFNPDWLDVRTDENAVREALKYYRSALVSIKDKLSSEHTRVYGVNPRIITDFIDEVLEP